MTKYREIIRLRSQSNQHCPQLQRIQNNCQQGAEGSKRVEPFMAAGS